MPPGPYGPPPYYPPPAPKSNWWAIAAVMVAVLAGVAVTALGAAAVLHLLARGSVDATKVSTGDCLAEIPDDTTVTRVDVVDCSEPHKGEVFAVLTMPDGDFPGHHAITRYQNRCEPQLSLQLPAAAADPTIGLFVLYPTEDSWDRGDRAVTCIATTIDARTGTLE
ncbi:septum formation family protein [Mycobacterium hubeiense]|uniref:septum formation family protein n=1 Tax=Mycobacterium hubeiense TaxID=1867256 RepID=UPI001E3CDBED|nr:septum formation family protein [Mycobacterium sp. QGD 101]